MLFQSVNDFQSIQHFLSMGHHCSLAETFYPKWTFSILIWFRETISKNILILWSWTRRIFHHFDTVLHILVLRELYCGHLERFSNRCLIWSQIGCPWVRAPPRQYRFENLPYCFTFEKRCSGYLSKFRIALWILLFEHDQQFYWSLNCPWKSSQGFV